MKPKIKITQSLIDRIKSIKQECTGKLYGTIYKNCQYILGLFIDGENNCGDAYFPADIDMCGAFQVGELNIDVINQMVKDVDVTDNPVLIAIPDTGLVQSYYVINNKLEDAPLTVIQNCDINSEFLYVRIKALVPFSSEMNIEAIKNELLLIRKQFSSGKIAFNCLKNDIFLLGCEEDVIHGGPDVNEGITLGKLFESVQCDEHDYSRNKESKQNLEPEVIQIAVYKKATLDKDAAEVIHSPVIQLEKRAVKSLELQLNVDALALVPRGMPLSKLYTTLVESACRNLRLIGSYIINVLSKMEVLEVPDTFQPEVLHFYPKQCAHFVSRVINKNDSDLNDVTVREELHFNFILPKSKPIFRRSNRHIFKGDVHGKGAPLVNPHAFAKPANNGGEQALVSGNYEYYHYCQNNMDDDGWGCAYRSLQTLASWFKMQGYTEKSVPSYKDIQQCLYDIGDKPANFVGSRQWIGSTEVSFVLETLLGVTSRIMYVSSGEELASKGPELIYHFNTQGSPIMIGGGVLAHTILGVDYNRDTGNIKFLILDPHYTGSEDIKTITSKGWCGWKGANFWDKNSYYNMCMPMVPLCL